MVSYIKARERRVTNLGKEPLSFLRSLWLSLGLVSIVLVGTVPTSTFVLSSTGHVVVNVGRNGQVRVGVPVACASSTTSAVASTLPPITIARMSVLQIHLPSSPLSVLRLYRSPRLLSRCTVNVHHCGATDGGCRIESVGEPRRGSQDQSSAKD